MAEQVDPAVRCDECGKSFAQGEHAPSGAIAFLNGEPYRWHPMLIEGDDDERIVLPPGMTAVAYLEGIRAVW